MRGLDYKDIYNILIDKINLNKMEYYVYTLSDPRTNVVRYVGKTKQPDDRLRRHMQKSYLEKYDKNTHKSNWIKSLLNEDVKPEMNIIDVGDSDNINELEVYWIEQFRQWGFKLTNLSEGGEVGVDWTGRKHKKSSIEKMINNNPDRKEVVQYDLNGNIIGEFRSQMEAVRETGCHVYLIGICCKEKKYYTVNNTTFRYKGDEFDYVPYNKNKQINSKPIIKYDLSGNFVNRFDSQRDAARDVGTGHSNIKRCCEVKYKTNTHGKKTDKPIVVKGFTYRYEGDEF